MLVYIEASEDGQIQANIVLQQVLSRPDLCQLWDQSLKIFRCDIPIRFGAYKLLNFIMFSDFGMHGCIWPLQPMNMGLVLLDTVKIEVY